MRWITFCCLHSVEYKNSSKARTCHSGSGFCKHIEIRGQHNWIGRIIKISQKLTRNRITKKFSELSWFVQCFIYSEVLHKYSDVFYKIWKRVETGYREICGEIVIDGELYLFERFSLHIWLLHIWLITFHQQSASPALAPYTKSSIIYLMQLLDKG